MKFVQPLHPPIVEVNLSSWKLKKEFRIPMRFKFINSVGAEVGLEVGSAEGGEDEGADDGTEVG